MKRICLFIVSVCLFFSSALADGTKQLMPNATPDGSPTPKGHCYLNIAAQEGGETSGNPSRNFARFYRNSDGTVDESCDTANALYINIRDPQNEVIHFGLGNAYEVSSTTKKNDNIYVRVKDPCGNVVWPLDGSGEPILAGKKISELTRIDSYTKAYYGPKSIDSRGYDYYSIKPDASKCDFNADEFKDASGSINCNYRIEFSNGEPLSKARVLQVYFDYFDVTVVNTKDKNPDTNGRIADGTGTAKVGRLWSYAWGLNTNASSAETYTTFYTISNDHYVSKVYLDGWRPYQFVVACNSYGSQNTGKVDIDRKSMRPATDPSAKLPEYKVFLTQPLQEEWGVAHVPNIPEKLTFAGDAITCEDLIFVVKLLFNENATLELYMDTDDEPGYDKVIAALLQANIIKDRGFHYPWKDTIIEENKIRKLNKESGDATEETPNKYAGYDVCNYTSPLDGCFRNYTLSLFDQSYEYTFKYKYTKNDVDYFKDSTTRYNPNDPLCFNPKYMESYPDNELIKGIKKSGSTYTIDDSKFPLNEPLGSERNPFLIQNKEQLENLERAINGTPKSGEAPYIYKYTIKDFYVFRNGDDTVKQDRTFTIDLGPNATHKGGEGLHFYLTAPTGNIQLDNNWVGIGTTDNPFRGTFRSGRYNPNPSVDDESNTANQKPGDQDTITFVNAITGLFSNCKKATIENIHIQGTITTENATGTFAGIGGICNYAEDTHFSHCTNNCNITVNKTEANEGMNANIGGILGFGYDCSIDSCFNYGNITSNHPSTTAVGGIVGSLWETDDEYTINFCYNSGIISSLGTKMGTAGIAGSVDGIDFRNCRNDGSVLSISTTPDLTGPYNAAGIVGYIENDDEEIIIHSCVNNGAITSTETTSGICLNSDMPALVTTSFCMNTGVLNGDIDVYSIAPYPLYVDNSISIQPAEYVNGSITTITDANKAEILESLLGYTEVTDPTTGETYYEEVDGMGESPFMLEEDGAISSVATACCGEMLRIEEAGRLFCNDSTFYIKWDGKDEDGECVTGEVTVNYQKNSGVTHFPFYDPENNKSGQGLVVYRISPIPDSVKNFNSLTYEQASPYQRKEYFDEDTHELIAGNTAESVYGYQALPKDFYQTSTYSDEMGIELKLYWDDTDISIDGSSCTHITYSGSDYIFGETRSGDVYTPKSFCTLYDAKKCTGSSNLGTISKSTYYQLVDGNYTKLTKDLKYCKKASACKGNETFYTKKTTTECAGITNLDYDGYYGSKKGGHLFPIDDFGNKNIMNTWWNGVEVKQWIPLTLIENEPALLHNEQVYGILPIVISRWEVLNLEKSVLLEWSTASEEDNDYFTIERSTNGVTWVAIGKVKGAGTTTMESYYSFEDKKPLGGISYYRLKQTDYNGEYSYSSVKCINRPDNANDNFIVYTKQDANAFIVEGEVIAACPIEIYNTAGSRIYNVSFNTLSVNKVLINVNDLPAGTYFVKICNGSKAVVKNW